jgi:hypothetical protein
MKLKKLLNENLWNERKFGEPLPTLADTTKAYKLRKEEELNDSFKPKFRDTEKVAKILGKDINDVADFLKKHKLDADDLLDVIEAGDRRRSSLMIIAAMNGRRRALKYLERSVKKQHQADTHHDLIYLLTRAHEAYKNSKK